MYTIYQPYFGVVIGLSRLYSEVVSIPVHTILPIAKRAKLVKGVLTSFALFLIFYLPPGGQYCFRKLVNKVERCSSVPSPSEMLCERFG